MQIELLRDFRRAYADFVANNARCLDREREKDVGVAQNIVVEVIVSSGAEIGEVSGPSAKRNSQSNFVLLVALASERQEPKSLGCRQIKQRPRKRTKRRRLVVTAVSSAQDPLQFRNLD